MNDIRVGIGVDAHAFGEGVPLVLGGVAFDHPRGLVGHSDGDVIAHALTDALLGAAGLGDIGSLFPSDDETYRGADSLVLLADAYARVRAAGFELVNADCVLIGEEPRIAAGRDEMSARLAGALGVGADRVAVRATTTDHLGFTGRGEGLAAQAVALLSRHRLSAGVRHRLSGRGRPELRLKRASHSVWMFRGLRLERTALSHVQRSTRFCHERRLDKKPVSEHRVFTCAARGALGRGQREGDAGAAARPVLGPDAAALSLDERARDRQSQAAASPGACAIATPEAFEHPLARLFAESLAGVLDRHLHLVVVGGHADGHGAVGGRVAERIRQQVLQDPLQLEGRESRAHRVADVRVQADAPQTGFCLDAPQRRAHGAGDRRLLELETESAGIDLCQLEQVVDHRRQRSRLLLERRAAPPPAA